MQIKVQFLIDRVSTNHGNDGVIVENILQIFGFPIKNEEKLFELNNYLTDQNNLKYAVCFFLFLIKWLRMFNFRDGFTDVINRYELKYIYFRL